MKFTFKDSIKIDYEETTDDHRMTVCNSEGLQTGPWIGKQHLLSCEYKGRYFICQKYTDNLPVCFELLKPNEIQLETIEPPKD